MSEIVEFVTKMLSIHLNVGQTLKIETSSIYLKLQKLHKESLKNTLIEQVDGSTIRIPQSLKLASNETESVFVQV